MQRRNKRAARSEKTVIVNERRIGGKEKDERKREGEGRRSLPYKDDRGSPLLLHALIPAIRGVSRRAFANEHHSHKSSLLNLSLPGTCSPGHTRERSPMLVKCIGFPFQSMFTFAVCTDLERARH